MLRSSAERAEAESPGKRPPDVLLLLSDGHHADYAGFAGHQIVRTPHLDRLAAGGAVFDGAYTGYPLCVPARMSLLTGRLASQTGVLSNDGVIGCDDATYMHTLAAAGYETVLIGRMHFKGDDQRHGFARRLVGDLSPTYWGHNGRLREQLGPLFAALGERGALETIGAGDSPILAYDRDVVRAALELLAERREGPLFLVVGFAGPHYPYIAPPDLYRYYSERADLPPSRNEDPGQVHPVVASRRQPSAPERLVRARAAYFGLIEHLDQSIGTIIAAWRDYLARDDRPGCAVYCTDHGDMAGEHDLVGKRCFFEGSARTPLIFNGAGIQAGQRFRGAVSLLDVGPTVCEMAGARRLPSEYGRSLHPQLLNGVDREGRAVLAEYVAQLGQGRERTLHPGRMVRKGRHKFATFTGFEEHDELFDLHEDPHEMRNLAKEPRFAATVERLRQIATDDWDVESIVRTYLEKRKHHWFLKRFGELGGGTDAEQWRCPESATQLPATG